MGSRTARVQPAHTSSREFRAMAHLSNSEFQPLSIAVLTVSDTRNIDSDTSGQALIDGLQSAGHTLAERAIVKDDVWQIRARVCSWIASENVQVVLRSEEHTSELQ